MILGGDSYRVLRGNGDDGGTGSLDVETPPTSAQDGFIGQVSREIDAINEWDVDLGDGVGGDHHDSGVPAGQRKPKVAPPEGLSPDEQKALAAQLAKMKEKEAARLAAEAKSAQTSARVAAPGTTSAGGQVSREELDFSGAAQGGGRRRPLEEQLPDRLEREFELGADKARKRRAAELQEAALANVRAAEATETYYAEVAKQRLDTAAVFEGEADKIGELKEKALSESLMQAQRVQDVARKVGAFAPRPGRLFSDASGAASFGAALALAAGAMESSRSGGPNVALGIIDNAIKRDVAAQELELKAMKAELQAEATVFQEIRAAYGDALAAQKAQSAAEKEAAVMYLRSQMDRYQGPIQKQQMMAVAHQLQASSNNDLIAMTKRMYRTVTRHKKGQVMDDLKRGDLKGPWLERDMSIDELQKSLKERAEEERIGAASAEEEGEAKALGRLQQAQREAQEAETLQTPPPAAAPPQQSAPAPTAPAPERKRRRGRPAPAAPAAAAPVEAAPAEQPSVDVPAQPTPEPMPEVPVFSEEKQARLAVLDAKKYSGGADEPLTEEEEQEYEGLLAEKDAIEAQQELAGEAAERQAQAQAQAAEDYEALQRDAAEVARQDAEARAQREAAEAQREAAEAQRERDTAAVRSLYGGKEGIMAAATQVIRNPKSRSRRAELFRRVSKDPLRITREAVSAMGGYPSQLLRDPRAQENASKSEQGQAAANAATMLALYGSYSGVPRGSGRVTWISRVGDTNRFPTFRNTQDSANMQDNRNIPTMALAPPGFSNDSRGAARFGRLVAGGEEGADNWLAGAIEERVVVPMEMDIGGGMKMTVNVPVSNAVPMFYNQNAVKHQGAKPQIRTGAQQSQADKIGKNPFNRRQTLYWRPGTSEDVKKESGKQLKSVAKLIDGSYAVQLYDAMYDAKAGLSGASEAMFSTLELSADEFEAARQKLRGQGISARNIRAAEEMLGLVGDDGKIIRGQDGSVTTSLNPVKTLAGAVSHFEGFKTPQRAELILSEKALGAQALTAFFGEGGGFKKWMSNRAGARGISAQAYRQRLMQASSEIMQNYTEPEVSYEAFASRAAAQLRQGVPASTGRQ